MPNVEALAGWDTVTYIEARVRQKGWSMSVCAQLAAEMNLDPRTVARYWEKAQRWTRRTLKPQDVEAWRLSQLQLLDESARAAFAEGRFADVAALVKVQASITGTNVAVKVEHSGNVAVSHHAAIDRVNALSVDELRELTSAPRLVLEAEYTPAEEEKVELNDHSAALVSHSEADEVVEPAQVWSGPRADATSLQKAAQKAEKAAQLAALVSLPVAPASDPRQAAVERALSRLRRA